MSVGLFDADMCGYNQIPFNLEIMKLAAYYKKHHEIVVLNTTLEPERYSKFYYRQDFNDVDLPTNIFMMKNVEFGGKLFNPNKYIPLPEDIEDVAADTSIYDIWRPKFINNKTYQRMFDTLQNTDHLRLSLDGQTIWTKAAAHINSDTTNKCIMLHDYDLSQIDGALEYIIDLLGYYNKYKDYRCIGMKFPIQLYTAADVIKWNQFKSSGFFYNIQYNGIMSNEEINAVCMSQIHTTKPHQFIYNVTPTEIDENDFYQNTLPFLYNQIQRINTVSALQLRYNLTFFKNSYIIDLLEFINNYGKYIQTIKNGRNSMWDYAKGIAQQKFNKGGEKLRDIAYVRELFTFVQKTNYPLFQQMYERHQYHIEGGKIRD